MTTLPVPKLPAAPPLPICNVPALMVVMPLLALLPVKVKVPAPDLVNVAAVADRPVARVTF